MGACEAQDLSRNHAARLIKQADDFINRQFILPYHSQGFEKAQNQEYVTPTGRLTSKGQSYFVQAHSHALEVSEPLEIKLTITGIRSETNHIRIAEFDWTYLDVPAKACRFVVQGGQGSAFFQLYDEGWRLGNVRMGTNYRTPCAMTEAQRQEEQAEIDAMAEAVRLEKERIRNALLLLIRINSYVLAGKANINQ